MNWFDKAIEAISPEWAYKRAAWRAGIRSYDGGNFDRNNGNWSAVNSTAEQTDAAYRDTIRARARDLERNSDMANAILSALERNVIGTGFRMQAKVTIDDGTENEALNKQIEDLWEQWKMPRSCDVTGMQSFDEITRMLVRRIGVDGSMLFVKCYTSGGVVPFSLQCREVDDLDQSVGFRATNGNRIVSGIELDDYNRPVAYYLKNITPDGFYLGSATRVEAKNVIHPFFKSRPTQVREMSILAKTLQRVRDVNEFIEAVSVKERVAACLAVFIKKINPSATGSYGRGGGVTDPKSGMKTRTLTPGMVMELQPGEDVGSVVPPNTSAGVKDFLSIHQRLAGSGVGLSYEATSRDMSQVNYSSARQGLLEDQTTYAIWQRFLIDHFLTEVYTEFLISAVLSKAITIPDFWANKTKYMKHRWISSGWSWIDPLKEVKANESALSNNMDTLERICAGRGLDWKDVMKQRAAEDKMAKELGLKLEPIEVQSVDENSGG